MAKLSLGEAAKTAGIGKTSLRRAIDAGRISAHKTEGGHFLIDPSELARFMDVRSDRAAPPSIVKAAPHGAPGGAAQIGRAAPPETDLEALSELETRALLAEQRAELLAAHLAETRADREALREDMADLRRDRDAWRAQAERLLIETQKDPEEAKAAPHGAPGGAAQIGRAAPPETDLEALSELETRALLAEQRAELLAAHLAETRADREALREDMADLRRDRDAWRAQAERLLIETQKDPEEAKAAPPGAPGGAALIDQPMSQVDPPTATEERRPGFWRRLFGKG